MKLSNAMSPRRRPTIDLPEVSPYGWTVALTFAVGLALGVAIGSGCLREPDRDEAIREQARKEARYGS